MAWVDWNSQPTITMTSSSSGTSGTEAIWTYWTSSCASTTSASSNTVWETWCGVDTIINYESTVSSSDSIWVTWNTECISIPSEEYNRQFGSWNTIVLDEEYDKRAEEREKHKKVAEVKACELLEELIGEEEFKIYKETGRIVVKGKNNDFVLEKTGKVTRIEKDKLVDLCIHLKERYNMPDTDNVIALKLLAENDDIAFNKNANVIRRYDKPDDYERTLMAANG